MAGAEMSDDSDVPLSERKWRAALNPESPEVQVFVLATRVEALTKEKEKLEREHAALNIRVSKMEKAFDRGAGILLVMPVIGATIGLLLSYWKVISKPWTNQ